MRRLLALAALATAASVAPAHASNVPTCSGTVDTSCRAWVCDPNCFERDCALWVHVPGLPVLCFSSPA